MAEVRRDALECSVYIPEFVYRDILAVDAPHSGALDRPEDAIGVAWD